MSIQERNDRALIYIHKCYLRNKRNNYRRCKNIVTAGKALYYGFVASMGYIAVSQFLVVLGH